MAAEPAVHKVRRNERETSHRCDRPARTHAPLRPRATGAIAPQERTHRSAHEPPVQTPRKTHAPLRPRATGAIAPQNARTAPPTSHRCDRPAKRTHRSAHEPLPVSAHRADTAPVRPPRTRTRQGARTERRRDLPFPTTRPADSLQGLLVFDQQAVARRRLLRPETKKGRQSRPISFRERRRRDSNPRYSFPYTGLANQRLKPLGHLSRQLFEPQRTPALERSRRDSNPRYVAVRRFSKPLPSTTRPLLQRVDDGI